MIYTAVKNFDRALYFYEIVITTPAMTVSHIMLEAYKKFVLVSLLLNGKVNRLKLLDLVGRFLSDILFVSDYECTKTHISDFGSLY